MPTIDPALVPTITPGNIFQRLTEDSSLNVRWLVATDPVLFEALNRPMADITLRPLIIAKALDDINLRLSHQALFPFLVTPKVSAGSSGVLELPGSWIWDMHVSIPAKWELLRLARIKRISGTNTGGSANDEVTGLYRFVFTAQEKGSAVEVALFHVDYQVDSFFTYQIQEIVPSDATEESISIDPGEVETIAGRIIFRTLDTEDDTVDSFMKALAPPSDTTDSNGDGIFDSPAIYEMQATPPGGISNPDDFLAGALNHGTGILVISAWNSIPSGDSDFNAWLSSSNFPFRIGATKQSLQGITIPSAMFREFSLIVPAPDQDTGDVTTQNHPVWISRIERLDDLATQLKFVFSTHTINASGTPDVVEFAQMTLQKSYLPGRAVQISPVDDLLEAEGTDQTNFRQGFGYGHVVLGSIWGSSTDEVDNFFEGFIAILSSPPDTSFSKETTILSSYSLDRNSRFTPTQGQWQALKGSTARLEVKINPSDSNRYILEADQGLGDMIDFRTKVGFPEELREHPSIEPEAFTGAVLHRIVKLVVDSSKETHVYETDILPRLRCLLGRDPQFGDMWFDGTLFKTFNGEQWQT